MAGQDRIALFPSRANLVFMKQRIVSATNGLSLLKRRRDALEIHLRQLFAELKLQREQMLFAMQDAIFSIAKANFLRTDFKPISFMNPSRAGAYLRPTTNKIVGVQVPGLELVFRQSDTFNLTGLASGGQQVQVVREKFQEALKAAVNVASLLFSLSVLSEAVKQNNMRVNGLEYTILPRYHNTLAYIREELDEFEREDFYRLKRSQAKQLKKKSDFIKLLRQRERERDANDPGYDFTDTHLYTPVDDILASGRGHIMQERRKTVTKIHGKTIVVETEKQKPLQLNKPISKRARTKTNVTDVKPKKVVTSSSSDSD